MTSALNQIATGILLSADGVSSDVATDLFNSDWTVGNLYEVFFDE